MSELSINANQCVRIILPNGKGIETYIGSVDDVRALFITLLGNDPGHSEALFGGGFKTLFQGYRQLELDFGDTAPRWERGLFALVATSEEGVNCNTLCMVSQGITSDVVCEMGERLKCIEGDSFVGTVGVLLSHLGTNMKMGEPVIQTIQVNPDFTVSILYV